MFRGPQDVDELLKELQPEEDAWHKKGEGRRLVGPPAASDVSDMMARMEARLGRLDAEVSAPVAYPRHGRRALGGAAAPAEAPAAAPRRRSTDPLVGGAGLAELTALEQAAHEGAKRETALRQQVVLLRQQLQQTDAAAPAGSAAAAAAVVPVQRRGETAEEGRELGVAVVRRVAQLKRQAHARVAAIDSLECEVRRLQAQLQRAGLGAAAAPPAAAPAPAAPASPAARLLQQLRRLNEALGASEIGGAAVAPGVHALRAGAQRACVPCAVFADGVMLYRGPFRPWAEAAALVRDVLTGHLPYELRERHPDGVVFEPLLDCTHSTHAQSVAAAQAAAAGGVRELRDVHAGAALLAPEPRLLERLPASVMRDGAVIPIRDEIAALLGRDAARRPPASAAAAPVDTEALAALREARLRRFS